MGTYSITIVDSIGNESEEEFDTESSITGMGNSMLLAGHF